MLIKKYGENFEVKTPYEVQGDTDSLQALRSVEDCTEWVLNQLLQQIAIARTFAPTKTDHRLTLDNPPYPRYVCEVVADMYRQAGWDLLFDFSDARGRGLAFKVMFRVLDLQPSGV